jgi:hypothetical protein
MEIKFNEKVVRANFNIGKILGIDTFTNFLEEPNGCSAILEAFYVVNKPDIHKLHISTSSNMTTANIQNSILGSTVAHAVDTDFNVAILLAVSQFIEYQGQEYKPI